MLGTPRWPRTRGTTPVVPHEPFLLPRGIAALAAWVTILAAVPGASSEDSIIRYDRESRYYRIQVVDYPRLEAKTTDIWTDKFFDPAKSGVQSFARHFGMANILFSDGSVHPERPADIDPKTPTTAMKWWEP